MTTHYASKLDTSAVREGLQTVVAITVTPFDAEGVVDERAFNRVLDRMLDAGVTAITVNGNTSEFYSLTSKEWHRLTELAIEQARGRALVIAAAGYDVATAIEMGRAAQELGATALMIQQPVHPYQSPEGWLEYHRSIGAALPDLALIPYLRSRMVTASLLDRLASDCPNVLGIKYAVPDPLRFTEVVGQVGSERLAWVCGLAEPWAPFFWLAGARGFTSGLVNVDPQLSLAMLQHMRRDESDAVMDIWRLIQPFEQLRAADASARNVSVVKEALAAVGLCSARVRPPLSLLSDSERDLVGSILATWERRGIAGGA
ncbi:dihydrodipicolinate synthase family protein [bacterium]|nr:MAG: dihydrodipicolinate synthase family protein [bacterium]